MMCEDCGIRPAKFHLMTIINGDRVERNLCPACMARHQKQIPGLDFSNLAGILTGMLEGRGAAQEEQAQASESYTCEQCGMTYAEFQKCGMLGCANCYQAFKTPMTALLQRVHGNTQHAGRVSGGARSGVSLRMNIDRLKEKIKRAIIEEDYETAAKLRDTIRSMTAQLQREEGEIRVKPPERLESSPDEKGDERDV